MKARKMLRETIEETPITENLVGILLEVLARPSKSDDLPRLRAAFARVALMEMQYNYQKRNIFTRISYRFLCWLDRVLDSIK